MNHIDRPSEKKGLLRLLQVAVYSMHAFRRKQTSRVQAVLRTRRSDSDSTRLSERDVTDGYAVTFTASRRTFLGFFFKNSKKMTEINRKNVLVFNLL